MIPVLKETDEAGNLTEINVIAGNLNGVQVPNPTPDSWAANPENGVSVLTVKMSTNATFNLPASVIKGVNRTLYFYQGASITIEDEMVNSNHLVRLESDENIVIKNGDADGCLFIDFSKGNRLVNQWLKRVPL